MAGMLSFLSDLNLDGEKLMIILIMYLLIKEKADIKLILALGYLKNEGGQVPDRRLPCLLKLLPQVFLNA